MLLLIDIFAVVLLVGINVGLVLSGSPFVVAHIATCVAGLFGLAVLIWTTKRLNSHDRDHDS